MQDLRLYKQCTICPRYDKLLTMSYTLKPLNENIVVAPLKTKEVQEYTGKFLVEPDSNKMDVLSYGRVINADAPANARKALTGSDFVAVKSGDIILYQKLASHKTNFGDPRLVLVPIESIEGVLEVAND